MNRQSELLGIARGLAARYRVRGWDFDELVNEAYLAMAQAPPDAPRLWLWSRAWQRLNRIAKAEGRRRAVSLTAEVAAPPEEVPDDLAAEVARFLPPAEAEVVAGLFFEGLSYEELAERRGVSRCRIWQLRTRALGRLRVRFAARGAAAGAAT
jgi:RNA polymerase sigma factor (sigma-70 family)